MSPQLCAHCRYRPVREAPRNAWRARYCSDKCRIAALHQEEHRRRRDQLNRLRTILGLPDGPHDLSSAELGRIIAVLAERLEIPDQGGHRGRRRVWAPHGSHKRYKQGCHEACCRAAETAYRRDLKARRAAEQAPAAVRIAA